MTNTTDNMTAVQAAAHRYLAGAKEAEFGRVDLTFAIAELIRENATLTFDYEGETFTRCALDYLDGEPKEDGKNSQKKHRAHFASICTTWLGIESPEDQERIRSTYVACLRSAAAMQDVMVRGEDGEVIGHIPHNIRRNKDGDIVLPAAVAFQLRDSNGELTDMGKRVFKSAKNRATDAARAVAKKTKTPFVEPTEDDIAEIVEIMEVECTGKREGVDVYGSVPTNSEALTIMRDLAVERSLAPDRRRRAGRAADGSKADVRAAAIVKELQTLLIQQDGTCALDVIALWVPLKALSDALETRLYDDKGNPVNAED